MKNNRVRCLTEAAMMAGLSLVLSLVIVFKMPQGGTVTAGCLLPIILLAMRRGPLWAMLAGGVSGLLQFVLTGEALHPLSILLDYILAYGLAGLSGFSRGGWTKLVVGTVIGCGMRFLAHLVSGATIFASYAPEGQNVWLYSAVYNGTYMLPELAVTLVEVLVLYKFANRLFKVK